MFHLHLWFYDGFFSKNMVCPSKYGTLKGILLKLVDFISNCNAALVIIYDPFSPVVYQQMSRPRLDYPAANGT